MNPPTEKDNLALDIGINRAQLIMFTSLLNELVKKDDWVLARELVFKIEDYLNKAIQLEDKLHDHKTTS